jgi:hypothetical protein
VSVSRCECQPVGVSRSCDLLCSQLLTPASNANGFTHSKLFFHLTQQPLETYLYPLNRHKYFNILRKFSTDFNSHNPMVGFNLHGSKTSGSIKVYLINYQIFNENSASRFIVFYEFCELSFQSVSFHVSSDSSLLRL